MHGAELQKAARFSHHCSPENLFRLIKTAGQRRSTGLEAVDQGVVLRHGNGPGKCDLLGARDIWVFEDGGTYYMHYDAAGPTGWLASLATSKDLVHWEKKGPVLELGKPDEADSKSASYGVTFKEGKTWHMYYLGTPMSRRPPT